MKKKHLFVALTFALGLIAVPAFAYGPSLNNPYATETGAPLTVHVDGSYVPTDVVPYAAQGRTYLPLRAACEAMGANVIWNQSNRTATISKNGTIIICTLDSKAMTVNGTVHYNDVAPQVRNGRTMLPIRPIAEALGGTLGYDGYTASVTIDTPSPDAPAPQLPSDTPSKVRWLVEKYYIPTTDLSDPFQGGSWLAYSSRPHTIPGLRYNYNYLFVSPLRNGTQKAIMVGYSNNDGYDSIGVDSYIITSQSSSCYWMKDTWSPFYWHGAGIGGGPGFLKLRYDFQNNGDLNLRRVDFYFQSDSNGPVRLDSTNYTNKTFSRI